METKFTPGPWKVDKQRISPTTRRIARVGGIPITGPRQVEITDQYYIKGVDEANARLIVKAWMLPELLELLMAWDKEHGASNPTLSPAKGGLWDRTRTAIAEMK